MKLTLGMLAIVPMYILLLITSLIARINVSRVGVMSACSAATFGSDEGAGASGTAGAAAGAVCSGGAAFCFASTAVSSSSFTYAAFDAFLIPLEIDDCRSFSFATSPYAFAMLSSASIFKKLSNCEVDDNFIFLSIIFLLHSEFYSANALGSVH